MMEVKDLAALKKSFDAMTEDEFLTALKESFAARFSKPFSNTLEDSDCRAGEAQPLKMIKVSVKKNIDGFLYVVEKKKKCVIVLVSRLRTVRMSRKLRRCNFCGYRSQF